MIRATAIVLITITLVSGGAVPKKKFNLHPGGRVIGGNETTIEKNPWQISLELLGIHSCGGSIIKNDTIVTAAHCIDDISWIVSKVVAGTTDLLKAETKMTIKDVKTHEKYNGFDYDVAIITLNEELIFSDKIQPIALPDAEPADGDEVVVSGWGLLSEDDILTPNILYEATVEIINRDNCSKAYSNIDGADVTERMICAGVPEGGKDACSGDSGGPLQKNGVLVGIVSWGVGCGEVGYPGVYTNVNEVVDWIKENAGL